MKKARKTPPINGREKMAQKRIKDIQSIVSCLFYLAQEANRENLSFVTDVLKESIAKIGRLSNGDELGETSASLIDHSLFEALNFLHRLAGMSPERLDYRKVLEEMQRSLHTGPKGDTSRKLRRFVPTLQ